MEWGDQEDFLVDLVPERAEQGLPPPPALLEKPELQPHHDWLFSAFRDLIHDRQVTMGYTGPITFTAIDAWAIRYGITDPDEFADFARIIRDLDAAYLDEMKKREPGHVPDS